MATPTAEQLQKINAKALVPLSADEVYTFPAKLIGDKEIPGRFMRLTPNFLKKISEQAQEGVSLLLDHSWANLGVMTVPIGRTYDSRIQQDGEELAVYADHYMKKGQEVAGISTDQIADGIDAGTIFDTSIGFFTTKHICSVCGKNYFSGDCSHFRGREYEGKQCIVEHDDGGLMENSLVFDGAYPGAGVVGLNQTSDNQSTMKYEVLSEDTKSLPGDGRVFYSFSNKTGFTGFIPKGSEVPNNELTNVLVKGDEDMKEEQKGSLGTQQEQANALAKANSLLGQIRTTLGVENDSDILNKLASLNAQAADGAAYKVKITEQACGAGVRALGDAFNVEAMKTALSQLPVSEIEKISASYEAQAQAALGGGGRHTQGEDVNLPKSALDGTAPSNPQADGAEKTPEQLRAAAKTDAIAALKNTGRGNLLKEES